jgi:hypothetical protein
MAGGKRFKIWEWALIFAIGVAALGAARAMQLSKGWDNAVFYTTGLFVVVLLALRPAWGRSVFWRWLAITLAVHCIALVIVARGLPNVFQSVHGLPVILVGMAEALFIAGILWRKSKAGEPTKHTV